MSSSARRRSSGSSSTTRARAELEAGGIEFIGEIQRGEGESWNHFRGPDGNVYEIISRRRTDE